MYFWIIDQPLPHLFQAEQEYLTTSGTSDSFASYLSAEYCYVTGVSVAESLPKRVSSLLPHEQSLPCASSLYHSQALGTLLPLWHPLYSCVLTRGNFPCPGADGPRIVSFHQILLPFDKIEFSYFLTTAWPVSWWCRTSPGRHLQPGEDLQSFSQVVLSLLHHCVKFRMPFGVKVALVAIFVLGSMLSHASRVPLKEGK